VKEVTRREFFRSCSRDTLKDVFGAWREFKQEQDNVTRLSCEERTFKFFKKKSGMMSSLEKKVLK
jgi:hypothetical protein